MGRVQVLCPDRARQAKLNAVHIYPHQLFVTPFEDRHDGAKHFFLRQPHRLLHVGKYRGLKEKAVFQCWVIRLFTPAHQAPAVFKAYFYIAFDFFKLGFADQRTHGGFRVCWNTRLVALGQELDDFFKHRIVNRFVQKHPAGRTAALTRPREIHAANNAADQLVDVGIGIGDQCIFTAQFKQHGFEVVGRGFHHRLAGGYTPNQGDFLHQGVPAHRVATFTTAAQKINHAGRKNIAHQFGQPHDRQRCLVG